MILYHPCTFINLSTVLPNIINFKRFVIFTEAIAVKTIDFIYSF